MISGREALVEWCCDVQTSRICGGVGRERRLVKVWMSLQQPALPTANETWGRHVGALTSFRVSMRKVQAGSFGAILSAIWPETA